ncbi:MAG: phosphoribosylformylglycinamidine synthase subunit PurS [Omnitrophica bacterium]|nr:phosphoribosylformylglycinamidine synthase subunit PurS [Candidatus Omnitrophota bacterium]
MLKAEIKITLRKTVADPQGLTVKHALESLGYKGLEEVRIGKLITIKLKSKSAKEAERETGDMCKKLLANPIIEDFKFKIRKR